MQIFRATFLSLFLSAVVWLPVFAANTTTQSNPILPADFIKDVVIKALKYSILDGSYDNATQCRRDLLQYMVGATKFQPWAIKMLDATGKLESGLFLGNTISLGSYTECNDDITAIGEYSSFTTQYCVITIRLDTSRDQNPIVKELRKTLPQSYDVFLKLIWGYCVPSSCSSSELLEFTIQLIRNVRLILIPANLADTAIEHLLDLFDPKEPICQNLNLKATPLTFAALGFAAFVIVLAVLATAYEVCKDYIRDCKDGSDFEHIELAGFRGANLNSDQNADTEIYELPKVYGDHLVDAKKSQSESNQSCCHKTVTSVSCYSSAPRIFNMNEPVSNISSLHGLRVISFLILLNAQNYYFAMNYAGWMLWLDKFHLSRFVCMLSMNVSFGTDTFLTVSGCLVAYNTLKALNNWGGLKKGGIRFWLNFYVHRYVRLTAVYGAVMLTYLGLTAHAYYGPQWNQQTPADKNCESNWWINLLYMNNLVDSRNMCMGHTWYLAVDMQLFWLSPLVIVGLYFNAWVGTLLALSWVVVQVVATYVISVTNGYRLDIFDNYLPPKNPDSGSVNSFQDIFIKPWCRGGAYALGMVAGYLVMYMRSHPAAVRRFTRRHKAACRFAASLMWLFTLAFIPFIVFIPYNDTRRVDIWSAEEAAAYRAGSRVTWSLVISWIIVSCEAGYGWWPAKFLSSSFWLVPSRLNYTAYLIHSLIIPFIYWHSESPIMLSDMNCYFYFIGNVGLSYIIAIIYSVVVELPVARIENLIQRSCGNPAAKSKELEIERTTQKSMQNVPVTGVGAVISSNSFASHSSHISPYMKGEIVANSQPAASNFPRIQPETAL